MARPVWLVLLTLFAAAGCLSLEEPLPSANELENRLESDLPSGAAVNEVRSYLRNDGSEAGIDGSWRISSSSQNSTLLEMGVEPDMPVINGIVRRQGHGLEVYFVFDEQERLQRVIVLKYEDDLHFGS